MTSSSWPSALPRPRACRTWPAPWASTSTTMALPRPTPTTPPAPTAPASLSPAPSASPRTSPRPWPRPPAPPPRSPPSSRLRAARQNARATALPCATSRTRNPALGVFVCDCNGDLARPRHCPSSSTWARQLPGVALAQSAAHGLLRRGPDRHPGRPSSDDDLNRVVVAGCSHRLFATEFDDLMRARRPRPPPPGPRQPPRAGRSTRTPTTAPTSPPRPNPWWPWPSPASRPWPASTPSALGGSQALTRRALVLGGGAAGMSAALQLAQLGIPVHLVERDRPARRPVAPHPLPDRRQRPAGAALQVLDRPRPGSAAHHHPPAAPS